MKNTLLLMVLLLTSLMSFAQYNNDVKIIKPLININTPDGGYYSEMLYDLVDSFYCGAIVKNNGIDTATGVFLRFKTSFNGQTADAFFSDTITLAPQQTDTLTIPGFKKIYNIYWNCSIPLVFDLYSDSVDQNPADNQDSIPNMFLFGHMWGQVSRSIHENAVFNDSLLPGFSAGDFLGVCFKVPSDSNQWWWHTMVYMNIKMLTVIDSSTSISVNIYRNGHLLVDQPFPIDTNSSIYYNGWYNSEGFLGNNSLFLYPDSSYMVGIRLDSGMAANLPLLIDTSCYHNFPAEAVAIINDTLRLINFVPLIGLVFDPEGIEEINNTIDFQLYPNPTDDWVILKAKEMETIAIFDVSGKLLNQIKTSGNQFKLSLKAYSSGSYLIRLTTKEGIGTKMIIKN